MNQETNGDYPYKENDDYKTFIDNNYNGLKEDFVKNHYPEFLDFCKQEFGRSKDGDKRETGRS